MDDKVMPPVERMLAERACERIIVDFIHRLDVGDPSSVAELFTPDGVWHWPFGDGSRRVDTAAFGVGDTLLLYTDGLVEARDAAGGFYALAERIRAAGWFGQAPDELLESIRSDLSLHVRQHFTDDVAMVAIKRMPAAH
ncbi:SpoIIE family protein phosphatase [Streptomyces sp. NPDC002763]|uniref:SpoIIE family protein phosphatase n=1 Tax=Streptomyces sp. NPDC002763 TaxID=3154427 RepID=UPI00331A2192